jgi:hypothetical protein
MADVPNAELAWRWQSWQWQIYKARGFGVGVLKLTAPHWQLAFILRSKRSLEPTRLVRACAGFSFAQTEQVYALGSQRFPPATTKCSSSVPPPEDGARFRSCK